MPSSLSGLSSQCGTGYSVTPITRRSGSRGTLRVPQSRDRPRRFCTRLLCLGLSRGPRPSDWFAGFMVHPCTRCSQGSPFGSTFGGYNSTIPWSRFSGLVRLSPICHLTALCARKAVPPLKGLRLRRLLSAGRPRPGIPRPAGLRTSQPLRPRMIKPPSQAPFAPLPSGLVPIYNLLYPISYILYPAPLGRLLRPS
jgi:hypothetical protein